MDLHCSSSLRPSLQNLSKLLKAQFWWSQVLGIIAWSHRIHQRLTKHGGMWPGALPLQKKNSVSVCIEFATAKAGGGWIWNKANKANKEIIECRHPWHSISSQVHPKWSSLHHRWRRRCLGLQRKHFCGASLTLKKKPCNKCSSCVFNTIAKHESRNLVKHHPCCRPQFSQCQDLFRVLWPQRHRVGNGKLESCVWNAAKRHLEAAMDLEVECD